MYRHFIYRDISTILFEEKRLWSDDRRTPSFREVDTIPRSYRFDGNAL
jgi:hypothetical protein